MHKSPDSASASYSQSSQLRILSGLLRWGRSEEVPVRWPDSVQNIPCWNSRNSPLLRTSHFLIRNVSLLKINDEIILSDYTEKQFSYFVSDIYEVKNDDLNPIYDFDKNLKCLTLITCNNVNKNRIILRAIMEI